MSCHLFHIFFYTSSLEGNSVKSKISQTLARLEDSYENLLERDLRYEVTFVKR